MPQSNITWDTVNKIFMGIVVVGLVGLFTWIIVIKEDIQNAKDETLDVVKSEIQKINSNIQSFDGRLEQNSAALEQRLEKNSAALERLREKMDNAMDDTFELVERRLGKA